MTLPGIAESGRECGRRPPDELLVDFENHRPSASDVGLVRASHARLWIFRGAHQRRYPAELCEAWQALGERVRFIHCAKSGRNALDLLIAFQLGCIVRERPAARVVVVSRDRDFDPLLSHLRTQGVAAERAASIAVALGMDADIAALEPSLATAAIDHLRAHPVHRPRSLEALGRHLGVALRTKLGATPPAELVTELRRRGAVFVSDRRVRYARLGDTSSGPLDATRVGKGTTRPREKEAR